MGGAQELSRRLGAGGWGVGVGGGWPVAASAHLRATLGQCHICMSHSAKQKSPAGNLNLALWKAVGWSLWGLQCVAATQASHCQSLAHPPLQQRGFHLPTSRGSPVTRALSGCFGGPL